MFLRVTLSVLVVVVAVAVTGQDAEYGVSHCLYGVGP